MILAGSPAAQTVSSADMERRLQLERWKTQMLRNLNMFVSPCRLVVQNLPATWGDDQLRALVIRHVTSPKDVTESRVMKDMRTGDGKSKEYGFVSLRTHEEALRVLRGLNNNPTIFTEQRRPIVAFSIENRTAINSRAKRLEKSRQNNPTANTPRDKPACARNSGKAQAQPGAPANEDPAYAGYRARAGEMRARSNRKLRAQSDIHHQHVKERKKLSKERKKSLQERRGNHIRQPQQKINKKNKMVAEANKDNFSQMVNKYRAQLTSANAPVAKTKWYQT